MPASPTVREHLAFALAMHRALAENGGNSCYSPYSVASALGLVSRAARGTAAAEIAALLTGSEPDPDAEDGVTALAEMLRDAAVLDSSPGDGSDADGTGADSTEESAQPVLAVVNTLWVWRELAVKPGFTDELANWPSGLVTTALFPDDPEGTRADINADVASTTHGLLPELLPAGTIGDDTVASLVTALYLRVPWTSPFDAAETAESEFHTPTGPTRVPMMRQSGTLGYAAHAGWRLVSLPAEGGVSATVLVPDSSLAEQEADLDAEVLAELLAAERETRVDLSLPRLTVDTRSALAPGLHSLGVRTMFAPSADFGALTEDPRLAVSDVLHQAVLRLDETGLEGAAATAAMMRLVSMPAEEPVVVRADRPFLLLIRNAATGAVYFLARVVRP